MPRVGVRTLLISASAVSLLAFTLVSTWPSFVLLQACQLAFAAAAIAAFVSTGERRAFWAGFAILGWLHFVSIAMGENGFFLSILLMYVLDWIGGYANAGVPGLPMTVAAIALTAIAYGGGCFGRWLYRREHGREPATAGRKQESRPPGGEG